ncbi:MAG: hypothetical protein ACR2GF_05145 [Acidimicrobiales bacterium]
MRKNRVLAAAAMTASLGVGGLAGFVLGAPGVSSAQTATTTPSTDAPTTTAPAPGSAPNAARPHDCPNMGGQSGTSSGSSAATNSAFHPGASRVRNL